MRSTKGFNFLDDWTVDVKLLVEGLLEDSVQASVCVDIVGGYVCVGQRLSAFVAFVGVEENGRGDRAKRQQYGLGRRPRIGAL